VSTLPRFQFSKPGIGLLWGAEVEHPQVGVLRGREQLGLQTLAASVGFEIPAQQRFVRPEPEGRVEHLTVAVPKFLAAVGADNKFGRRSLAHLKFGADFGEQVRHGEWQEDWQSCQDFQS
jgi:hypothetical protein